MDVIVPPSPMLFHGTYRFGRKLIACRNAYCTGCDAPCFAEGWKSWLVLHVFWIPLIPIGTDTKWFCGKCRKEVDSHRPSRPLILIAGMLCGFFFFGMGTFAPVQKGEERVGIYIATFGLVMIMGTFWLLRRQDYRRYSQRSLAVVPLTGDRCPYCNEPLFANVKPRCHSCRIQVITK